MFHVFFVLPNSDMPAQTFHVKHTLQAAPNPNAMFHVKHTPQAVLNPNAVFHVKHKNLKERSVRSFLFPRRKSYVAV